MTLLERSAGDVTVLELDGKLTLDDGAPKLKEAVDALIGRGRTRLVLEMEKVGLLDTTGLSQIIQAHLSTTKRGGGIRLLRPTQRVITLLTVTRLIEILPPYATEEEAIGSLGEG